MRPTIAIDNVSIMFGDNPDKALALADQGRSRSEIQAETGDVLGVHNCTLDVAEGEIVVLMGLSGSGKSTLLRAVNRLNPISRGTVRIASDRGELDITTADRKTLRFIRTHLVSMVFQQFALLPWRTVEENVGFGLELSGEKRSRRSEAVREQLALVGLQDWAGRKVGELSGGMQQRVGLARAFATGAPVLLMDEPFSALDPLIRNRLQDELLEFQSRLKKTILFVSHDLDEAFRLGNRIAIMEGGRIVQCGTPHDIVMNPANDYVADFVANMNPLSMLSASDVMSGYAGRETEARQAALSATIKPETPLVQVLDALSERDGTVAVVENGAIRGTIDARDVIAGLTRHRRSARSRSGNDTQRQMKEPQ